MFRYVVYIDNLKKKDIFIETKLFKCKLVLKIPFFEFSILLSILSTQFNDILRVKLQMKSLNHLKLGVHSINLIFFSVKNVLKT